MWQYFRYFGSMIVLNKDKKIFHFFIPICLHGWRYQIYRGIIVKKIRIKRVKRPPSVDFTLNTWFQCNNLCFTQKNCIQNLDFTPADFTSDKQNSLHVMSQPYITYKFWEWTWYHNAQAARHICMQCLNLSVVGYLRTENSARVSVLPNIKYV